MTVLLAVGARFTAVTVTGGSDGSLRTVLGVPYFPFIQYVKGIASGSSSSSTSSLSAADASTGSRTPAVVTPAPVTRNARDPGAPPRRQAPCRRPMHPPAAAHPQSSPPRR